MAKSQPLTIEIPPDSSSDETGQPKSTCTDSSPNSAAILFDQISNDTSSQVLQADAELANVEEGNESLSALQVDTFKEKFFRAAIILMFLWSLVYGYMAVFAGSLLATEWPKPSSVNMSTAAMEDRARDQPEFVDWLFYSFAMCSTVGK